jgi:phage terminase large subunit
MKLVAELTQVTYRQNEVGKLIIEKKPDGMKSPNLADTVMTHFAPKEFEPVEITQDMLQQVARMGRRRTF